MKITFCGDTHGQFMALDNVIKRERPDIVIQCGDFGIWPQPYGRYDKVKTKSKIPIYFCRGNHENHDLLDTFPDFKISNLKTSERIIRENIIEDSGLNIKQWEKLKNIKFPLADNIYLCETGSILSPAENLNILFIGGALSIDKHYRKEHKSWWKQETMWKYQIDYLLDLIETKPQIDIIVSHTAPTYVAQQVCPFDSRQKFRDPINKLLQVIYEKVQPKQWFFGHFHVGKTIKLESGRTYFHALNMCNIYKNGKYDDLFFHSIEI